jgi:hypothetical protein
MNRHPPMRGLPFGNSGNGRALASHPAGFVGGHALKSARLAREVTRYRVCLTPDHTMRGASEIREFQTFQCCVALGDRAEALDVG